MRLRKVLVLHKKSTFQLQAIEHRESRFVKLLAQGHEALTRVKVAHSEHLETLSCVESELKRRDIEFASVARSELEGKLEEIDLLISVGGDGTFLDASHYVRDIPLLGVNSSKSSSFGHFCHANKENFGSVLDQIGADTIELIKLLRLEAKLNGRTLPHLILNELLVSHSSPAGTSRYFIEINGISEEQRSSGIWIGTAAGSTGSIRSAGGRVLPITSKSFEYIVREPCLRPKEKWELTNGVLDESLSIRLTSEMRTGSIFLDGQHIVYPFYIGDELVLQPSAQVLKAYLSPNVNDIFIGQGQ